MSNKLKILVIRLSSIGDIVLTTPLIRCLKQQANAEIDYLTKRRYKDLLISNPNIREIFCLGEGSKNTLEILRKKEYDLVVDLQNNFRSLKVRLSLGLKSYVFSKENFKRYLLIYFGVDLLKNHIVDRYFKTVEQFGIKNDNQGIDYFLNKDLNVEFNINQDYIAWNIGAAHEPKKLSVTQISAVINQLDIPVVLIGGITEKKMSDKIISTTHSSNVYDFCGDLSFEESAYLIKNSKMVLTNDTGMMHIASAFNSPIISFWGCTKPSLGFHPYMPNEKSEHIIINLSKRPCSKYGKSCRFFEKGCIKKINSSEIYNTIIRLLK